MVKLSLKPLPPGASALGAGPAVRWLAGRVIGWISRPDGGRRLFHFGVINRRGRAGPAVQFLGEEGQIFFQLLQDAVGIGSGLGIVRETRLQRRAVETEGEITA